MTDQVRSQKEILELLKSRHGLELSPQELETLRSDSRKGVQRAFKSWSRSLEKVQGLQRAYARMSLHEHQAMEKGFLQVAGIDEAGRGPLAGPVVAAAVVLDPEQEILGLDDSKKLSQKRREELYNQICTRARAWAVGIVDSETIDQINILQATKRAMVEALSALRPQADFLLIDFVKLPECGIGQLSLTRGESHSVSIAAASIIAKVTRDRLMEKYAMDYPRYNFSSNKGYGSREHIEALRLFGPSPIHRQSIIGGILGLRDQECDPQVMDGEE